jgi:hypothetical protein
LEGWLGAISREDLLPLSSTRCIEVAEEEGFVLEKAREPE